MSIIAGICKLNKRQIQHANQKGGGKDMDLRKILSVILISMFAVFVFAYDGQAKEETGFDDKEIRIAQWGPQTGPAAAWGNVARGSKLVFDIVNAEGGIAGRQIKYYIRDDQYNPSQTVAGVKELVERYGIFAFVGGVGTACCQSVMSYLLEKEIIWISPCTGAAAFYKPFNPYIWNMWPSYENDASVIAKFAIETKKFKKIAVFYQNDGYGTDSLDSIKYRFAKNKMELVAAVPVEPIEKDLSSQIQKLKASGAEAVLAYVAPTQAAIAVKTAVSAGFKTQWMFSYNLSDFEMMNKITDGLWAKEGVITSAFTQEPYADNALTKKYTEAMKKYAAPTERWSIFYMAGVVVAEPMVHVLKKVGKNLSTKAVQDELNKINNFQGVGPKVTWSATNHMGPKAVQIWQCGPKGEIITLQKWTENEISRD
jgi:branched-chain amino acid transport system substrate-binding protein